MHLFLLEYIRGSSAQVVIALSLGVVIDGDIRMFAIHRVLFEIREAWFRLSIVLENALVGVVSNRTL